MLSHACSGWRRPPRPGVLQLAVDLILVAAETRLTFHSCRHILRLSRILIIINSSHFLLLRARHQLRHQASPTAAVRHQFLRFDWGALSLYLVFSTKPITSSEAKKLAHCRHNHVAASCTTAPTHTAHPGWKPLVRATGRVTCQDSETKHCEIGLVVDLANAFLEPEA